MKFNSLINPIVVLAIGGALSTPSHLLAQSAPSDAAQNAARTWKDLGFNQLPEGFSTDVIPLFEGLNEARGTWSFEGESLATRSA